MLQVYFILFFCYIVGNIFWILYKSVLELSIVIAIFSSKEGVINI